MGIISWIILGLIAGSAKLSIDRAKAFGSTLRLELSVLLRVDFCSTYSEHRGSQV
jgi:hypothetical protein